MSDPIDTARTVAFSAVVTGVRFPFCVMNAAGSAATTEEVRALRRSPCGAIVLKTVTVHPFIHPGFRALHNPGFDKLLPLVRDLVSADGRPVVASIAGASVDELGILAKAFADAGASIIEVNLADPWVEAMLAPFESEAMMRALTTRVASAGCPCWVKLPERVPVSYDALVTVLLDSGVRGVVAHHDFHGFEKLLLEAPAAIDVVVWGAISTGYEVATVLRKGAKAVQIDAALRTEGPAVFARLEREMRRLADSV